MYVGVRARVCVLEYFRWEFKAERVNELQGFASVFTMNSFILINVAKEIALLVSGGWVVWELMLKFKLKNSREKLK